METYLRPRKAATLIVLMLTGDVIAGNDRLSLMDA
jgi:hypothetical protein